MNDGIIEKGYGEFDKNKTIDFNYFNHRSFINVVNSMKYNLLLVDRLRFIKQFVSIIYFFSVLFYENKRIN